MISLKHRRNLVYPGLNLKPTTVRGRTRRVDAQGTQPVSFAATGAELTSASRDRAAKRLGIRCAPYRPSSHCALGRHLPPSRT